MNKPKLNIDEELQEAAAEIDSIKSDDNLVIYLSHQGLTEQQAIAITSVLNNNLTRTAKYLEDWVHNAIRVSVCELVDDIYKISQDIKNTVKEVYKSIPDKEIERIIDLTDKAKAKMKELEIQADSIKESIKTKLELIYGIAEKPNFNKLKKG